MARVEGRSVKLWGRHDGQWHERIIDLYDLLPNPDSDEYSILVGDLLRRLAAQVQVESRQVVENA
jgi:hypothetical protein